MDEAAVEIGSSQSRRVRIVDRSRHRALWGPLIQSALRTMFVVMSDVLGQNLLEMASTEDEDAVETLSADGAHESFGERVRPRSSNRGLDDEGALGAKHLVEAGGERVSTPG